MLYSAAGLLLAAVSSLLITTSPAPKQKISLFNERTFKLEVFRREERETAPFAGDNIPGYHPAAPNRPGALSYANPSGTHAVIHATPQPQPIANKNRLWITSVDVGTPPQTLNITVDTGSGGLWFRAGHDVPQAQENINHALFDPAASSTFVNHADEPFNAYVAGVTGNYAPDTVNIGGASNGGINIPNARFGVIGRSNDRLRHRRYDGDESRPERASMVVTDYTDPWTGTLPNYLQYPVMTANLLYGDIGTFGFGTLDPSELGAEIIWNKADIAPSSA